MLIERGYVLLHKIKVQQSRKIRKREKKNLASILGNKENREKKCRTQKKRARKHENVSSKAI